MVVIHQLYIQTGWNFQGLVITRNTIFWIFLFFPEKFEFWVQISDFLEKIEKIIKNHIHSNI
jgi:hypothetical protein